MANNPHSEAGDTCPSLWPASYPAEYTIVTLSGDAQDVAAYAAAIALAQEEYPGHFGHKQFTQELAETLLTLSDAATYAIRDTAGVMGAMTVRMAGSNAQFEYLFRLKAISGNALGKRLLLRGLQHAHLHGAKRVELDVMTHNRVRELYEEVGFEPHDDDLLDMDRSRNNDAISMRIYGEQAIGEAQTRLQDIIEQQLNPDLEQQSA